MMHDWSHNLCCSRFMWQLTVWLLPLLKGFVARDFTAVWPGKILWFLLIPEMLQARTPWIKITLEGEATELLALSTFFHTWAELKRTYVVASKEVKNRYKRSGHAGCASFSAVKWDPQASYSASWYGWRVSHLGGRSTFCVCRSVFFRTLSVGVGLRSPSMLRCGDVSNFSLQDNIPMKKKYLGFTLRTVLPFVTAHTFCASWDIRVS